jgi:predicted RNA-binding Zn-ribbon protein involved in translation (DUF1610 family)
MKRGGTNLDSAALAALADLRRRQRLMATFTAAFLLIVLAIAMASLRGFNVALGRISRPLEAAVVVTWAGAIIFVLRTYAAKCPRCGEKYFVKAKFPRWHNNLAQRCMNCELPLRAPKPADTGVQAPNRAAV